MVGVLEKVLKHGFSGTHMHIESVDDALGHNSPYRISKKKKEKGRVLFVLCNHVCQPLGLVAAGPGRGGSRHLNA